MGNAALESHEEELSWMGNTKHYPEENVCDGLQITDVSGTEEKDNGDVVLKSEEEEVIPDLVVPEPCQSTSSELSVADLPSTDPHPPVECPDSPSSKCPVGICSPLRSSPVGEPPFGVLEETAQCSLPSGRP